jgi:hypothetical protein
VEQVHFLFEAITDLRVMYWDDEPATERQLMLLRDAGFVQARPLTRTEAARLIREYHRNPARAAAAPVLPPARASTPNPPPRHETPRREPPRQEVPRPQTPRQEIRPPTVTAQDISESTKLHAHRLRLAAENALQAQAANPEAPNVRADAVSTLNNRAEFWQDTCREVKEMHFGSVQVFELYQRFGCRFYAPNRSQVEEVLRALDSAMPVWDRDHLELFYQTLALNFPDLVRRV